MLYLIITMTLLMPMAQAQDNYTYVSPQSAIIMQDVKTIKLKTRNNTPIDLVLDQSGQLEAAEGVNLNRGDVFVPGQGMLPLSTIEERMRALGQRIYGRWRLVKYQEYGWVYKVNVADKGRSVFHLVNAYSGQLIGTMTKLDPLPLESQVAKD